MRSKKSDDGYFLYFDRGEKILESIKRFVQENEIPSGVLSGVGAVMNTRLGFYHLDRKKYDERLFRDEAELVSLLGNVSWFDGQPVIHCHVCIGDTEFRAMAGHLFEADVAVTVEIFLAVKGERIVRKFRPDVGLNLWDLS